MTITCQQQVNFSVKDGVPEDQYKAVLRRSGGSMEMIASESEKDEMSYRLVSRDWYIMPA